MTARGILMQLSIKTKIMKRQLTQAVTTFIERCRNQLIPILQSTYYNKQNRKCTPLVHPRIQYLCDIAMSRRCKGEQVSHIEPWPTEGQVDLLTKLQSTSKRLSSTVDLLGPSQPLFHPLQLLGAHTSSHFLLPLSFCVPLSSLFEPLSSRLFLPLRLVPHVPLDFFQCLEFGTLEHAFVPRFGFDSRHQM